MEVADTFMPTAGAVGLLPMVTYFFLVVTMFAFIGNFIFALVTQPAIRPELRTAHALTSVIAAITLISYYFTQADYQTMLRELATVADLNDRQTLIRESYNAISQYRYMDWFITSPLLLAQVVFRPNLLLSDVKRPFVYLFIAVFFLFFTSYIGHEQLSFDNEIQIGLKVGWGVAATIAYGFIVVRLQRLLKQFGEQTNSAHQPTYRQMFLLITTCWGVYLLGYFLTVTLVDFNWIHLLFTLADLISKIGIGITIYFINMKPVISS